MSDSVGNVLGTVHEEESFTDKEDQIKNSESPMGIVIVEAPGDTIADKQYAEWTKERARTEHFIPFSCQHNKCFGPFVGWDGLCKIFNYKIFRCDGSSILAIKQKLILKEFMLGPEEKEKRDNPTYILRQVQKDISQY